MWHFEQLLPITGCKCWYTALGSNFQFGISLPCYIKEATYYTRRRTSLNKVLDFIIYESCDSVN